MHDTTPAGNGAIQIWDPLVRLFHWNLVAAFAVAWPSGDDDFLGLHAWSGYLVGGLVLFRLVWAVIGTEHAKFRDFVYPPAVVLSYAGDLVRGRARRYLGHNPLGGAMVVALLAILALATVTGLALHAAENNAGPLAGLLRDSPPWLADAFEASHEFLSNLALLLAGLHIAGVAVSSRVHHENLVRAMITGRKRA